MGEGAVVSKKRTKANNNFSSPERFWHRRFRLLLKGAVNQLLFDIFILH
jgi:hypothetical protein